MPLKTIDAAQAITCPSAFYNTTSFEKKIIQFMQNINIPILCPNQTETTTKLPGDEIEFYLDYHGISSIRKSIFELLGHFKGKNKELNLEDKDLDDEWRERVLRRERNSDLNISVKMNNIKEWLTM